MDIAALAGGTADHSIGGNIVAGACALNVPPSLLQQSLQRLLGDARLKITALPGTSLKLWLIDDSNMDRAFSSDETRRILEAPPYWCFCWASGLVLARWLAEHPHWVRDRSVLDFGTGSGVAAIAAIAAAHAGAHEVVACDLDADALSACRTNAQLNDVTLSCSTDFFAEKNRFDLILVADVLYDRSNLFLLDQFLSRGKQVLLADSRVKDFHHPLYRHIGRFEACTWPDLAEPDTFRQVNLYHATR